MKTLATTLLCICLLTIGLSPSFGQNRKKEVLTNESVIELVKMGFSDGIVIEKIRQSDRNFDTSIAGMKQLKAARVSEPVMKEIFNTQSLAASSGVTRNPDNRSTENGSSSNFDGSFSPSEPGIYIIEKGELMEINPTTFSGTKSNFLGAALTYGIMKGKMRATVRGGSANTKTSNRRPEFLFSFDPAMRNSGAMMAGFLAFGASSPGEFVLVKMDRKTNTRETVLAEFSGLTGSTTTGALDKDVRDFGFEKIRAGVFKVTPKVDLADGEYCFYYAGTPAGLGFAGGKLFDFGVNTTAR